MARAPRFAGVRADYDRVLKQRGALLRAAAQARRGSRSARRKESDTAFAAAGAGDVLSTLEVWDAHLAKHGAELLRARLELIEALRPLVAGAYAALAPASAPATLAYRSTLSTGGDADEGVRRVKSPVSADLSIHRRYPQTWGKPLKNGCGSG